MICSTVNQFGAFGLTLIVVLMWNATVISSFGVMLLDILPRRQGTLALIGCGFSVALACLGTLVFAGVCQ